MAGPQDQNEPSTSWAHDSIPPISATAANGCIDLTFDSDDEWSDAQHIYPLAVSGATLPAVHYAGADAESVRNLSVGPIKIPPNEQFHRAHIMPDSRNEWSAQFDNKIFHMRGVYPNPNKARIDIDHDFVGPLKIGARISFDDLLVFMSSPGEFEVLKFLPATRDDEFSYIRLLSDLTNQVGMIDHSSDSPIEHFFLLPIDVNNLNQCEELLRNIEHDFFMNSHDFLLGIITRKALLGADDLALSQAITISKVS